MDLYRAAPARNPYFSRGSYWTVSMSFARQFARWLDEHFPKDRPHVIYATADADPSRILHVPFELPLPSNKVTELVRELKEADPLYDWLAFWEPGAFEGILTENYVCLSEAPVTANLLASGS
jgi:hypothetical protein